MRQMRRNHCQLYKNFEVALAESKLPTFGTVTDWFYHAALNREICSLIANLSQDDASFFPCSPVLQPIKEASASLDDELDKYFGKAQSVSRCDDNWWWSVGDMNLWHDGLMDTVAVWRSCISLCGPGSPRTLRRVHEAWRNAGAVMQRANWILQGGVVKHEGCNKCFCMFSLVFEDRVSPDLCSLQDRKVAAMLLRSARTKAGSCSDHSIWYMRQ